VSCLALIFLILAEMGCLQLCYGMCIALVSVRIRIQHFRSMRIQFRIRNQEFGDIKFSTFTFDKKSIFFLLKLQCIYSKTSIKDVQAMRKSSSRQKSSNQESLLLRCLRVIFALLVPDPQKWIFANFNVFSLAKYNFSAS
jgi:hypothetical protein